MSLPKSWRFVMYMKTPCSKQGETHQVTSTDFREASNLTRSIHNNHNTCRSTVHERTAGYNYGKMFMTLLWLALV